MVLIILGDWVLLNSRRFFRSIVIRGVLRHESLDVSITSVPSWPREPLGGSTRRQRMVQILKKNCSKSAWLGLMLGTRGRQCLVLPSKSNRSVPFIGQWPGGSDPVSCLEVSGSILSGGECSLGTCLQELTSK